ncbi:NAD dependent epimerase/dehydratase [Aspergillus heterothallicus]
MAAPLPFPIIAYPRRNHQPWRQKEMKVLAFGMPRTGTMSLYTALNELGYNCYHMAEAALDYRNGSLTNWNKAIVAKYDEIGEEFRGEDFDKMLCAYDAVTDIPSILFAEELMDAYPDAKIILTIRDVNEWLPSMERSLCRILKMKRWRFLELIDNSFTLPYLRILRTTLNLWTDNNIRDKDQLAAAYIAHYAQIRGRALMRGHRVLEYRVADGWEPLCRFLKKPVPEKEKPFPWVNRDNFIAQYHYIGFWLRLFYLVRPVVVTLFGLWVVVEVVEAYFEYFYGVNSIL